MHFVGNSTWFVALLVIHVFGAIAGIGPAFSFSVIGPLAGKTQGPGALSLLEAMHGIEFRLITPVALGTQWLTGLGMIFNRGLNHNFFSDGHRAWLLWGILIYIAVLIISYGFNTPAVSRMIKMAKAGQINEEFQKLGARAAKLGPVLTILTVAIAVLMIWKPGSGCGPLYRC